jgi:hypothetical protein
VDAEDLLVEWLTHGHRSARTARARVRGGWDDADGQALGTAELLAGIGGRQL